MPRCYRTNARSRLMRLTDHPQLVFHAPAAAPFPPADDLHRRHDLKLDLAVHLKVTASASIAPSAQGGRRRTDTLLLQYLDALAGHYAAVDLARGTDTAPRFKGAALAMFIPPLLDDEAA
jgi:hypothetical protein